MPMKRLKPINLTEKEDENRGLANWAFDSHYWIEYYQGYFECKWCKKKSTSAQGINIEFPLCLENPIIKQFIQKITND